MIFIRLKQSNVGLWLEKNALFVTIYFAIITAKNIALKPIYILFTVTESEYLVKHIFINKAK